MMAGRDTKTRYEGVFARHALRCPKTVNKDSKCKCSPRYYGVAYDRNAKKHRKTGRLNKATEARNARTDLIALINSGKPMAQSDLSLAEAIDKFAESAAAGVARNKHGRPYKRSAIVNLRSSLNRYPDDLKLRRLDGIGRGDVQHLVDDLHEEGISGSRIRSIVNATRSLYRWAMEREFAIEDPAAAVRLPAMDSVTRDRVATPLEAAQLLEALAADDRVPFAIAIYTGARAAEIRQLDWTDVDLKRGVLRIADGKTEAAQRIIPIVKPLRSILRAASISQGRPATGKVCPPRRSSKSGELHTGMLLKRAYKVWETAKLAPINLHECRHTCASWLSAAGVKPKVVSVWMGHATPELQPGAAAITLSRYVHVLDGDMERALNELDAFIAERVEEETANTHVNERKDS